MPPRLGSAACDVNRDGFMAKPSHQSCQGTGGGSCTPLSLGRALVMLRDPLLPPASNRRLSASRAPHGAWGTAG